ncbi:MAG: hypothetical protein U0807_01095 [Candidatus Binatia bacterium]
MDTDAIVAMVKEISGLVRDRRYDLALALTERLEEELDAIPPGDVTVTQPVRDLVAASRLMTQSLITLRGLALH